MKISIVTPSYNQGKFIEDAINSVMIQNYPNFEHIIIDGGSTDNTIEILNRYPHLKWISEKDDGQSDALNKGFKIASGDYIGWLNADDYYLPETLSIVAKELSNDNIDAIYSNYRFVDANKNITRELYTQVSKKWMSLFYCFIPSTTFFFKRKIIESKILIDRDFHISMDKEFFAHIYFSGYKIIKVNAFFAHFRWHESNKSIDTSEVKTIRMKEGLTIFNRYSKYSLPNNIIGLYIYKQLKNTCALYRFIGRRFKTGLF